MGENTTDYSRYLEDREAFLISENSSDEDLINYCDNQFSMAVEVTEHAGEGGNEPEDVINIAWELVGRWHTVAFLHQARIDRGLE